MYQASLVSQSQNSQEICKQALQEEYVMSNDYSVENEVQSINFDYNQKQEPVLSSQSTNESEQVPIELDLETQLCYETLSEYNANNEEYETQQNQLSANSQHLIKDSLTERTSMEIEYIDRMHFQCSDPQSLINFNQKEDIYEVNPLYFSYQQEINPAFRLELLNWMMEACQDLCMKRTTFHLSMMYVDLYLSKVQDFQTSNLQLLGAACLYLALKIEEVGYIEKQQIIIAAGNSIDGAQLNSME